jgi:transposase InsO family protein
VNPFGGGHLDVLDSAPRLAGFDQFGLVQTVDRFSQRVVIQLPTAPTEGWIPACARRSLNRIDVYTSAQLADFAREHNLVRSVGRTAVCWDNAQAESFWATLKVEFYDR